MQVKDKNIKIKSRFLKESAFYFNIYEFAFLAVTTSMLFADVESGFPSPVVYLAGTYPIILS